MCFSFLFDGQWMDREGKTPLIVACMNPVLYNVAKTLIELGANVNSYRPGTFLASELLFSLPLVFPTFVLTLCASIVQEEAF